MAAYYNDNEPYAAAWLRNLIGAGLIPAGDVDERSIKEVQPDDVRKYTQAHFFAGIGGWSRALLLSNWGDDREVWTGSCPCQPFSAAGKREGFADPRHLWPEWFRLIKECRPPVVFGEQVAAAVGWGWLDTVFADLEGQDYACRTAILPAGGVGAPHIRQRLWFVADSQSGDGRLPILERRSQQACAQSQWGGEACELVDPTSEQVGFPGRARQPRGTAGELGDADTERFQRCANGSLASQGREASERPFRLSGGAQWADCDWLPCTDGKARPVEPGTFPLAHGVPGRVGRLRAYGNAIVPQAAAEFIKAYMAARP